MLRHHFWACMLCDLDLRDMTLVTIMTQPWVMEKKSVKYYPDPIWQWGVMVRTPILAICVQLPWPWRYDLASRSWQTLWSWTKIVWYIHIQFGSEELWHGHRLRTCVHSDLDLSDATLGLGHNTSLDHGKQFCDILSSSDERGQKLWPGHEVNRQTDRQTNKQTDRVIPIYPKTLFAGV